MRVVDDRLFPGYVQGQCAWEEPHPEHGRRVLGVHRTRECPLHSRLQDRLQIDRYDSVTAPEKVLAVSVDGLQYIKEREPLPGLSSRARRMIPSDGYGASGAHPGMTTNGHQHWERSWTVAHRGVDPVEQIEDRCFRGRVAWLVVDVVRAEPEARRGVALVVWITQPALEARERLRRGDTTRHHPFHDDMVLSRVTQHDERRALPLRRASLLGTLSVGRRRARQQSSNLSEGAPKVPFESARGGRGQRGILLAVARQGGSQAGDRITDQCACLDGGGATHGS